MEIESLNEPISLDCVSCGTKNKTSKLALQNYTVDSIPVKLLDLPISVKITNYPVFCIKCNVDLREQYYPK